MSGKLLTEHPVHDLVADASGEVAGFRELSEAVREAPRALLNVSELVCQPHSPFLTTHGAGVLFRDFPHIHRGGACVAKV